MSNRMLFVTVFILACIGCILCVQFPTASIPYHGEIASSSSSAAKLNLSVISWNMAEKAPTEVDCTFIRNYRTKDVVVFGIQECEDIRPRRREGHRTRKWRYLQRKLLGREFQCLASHKMGGLFVSVYAKKHARKEVQGVQLVDVACGVGNVLTNKGAVGVVMRVGNKTVALVNSHLAAHQKYTKQRNLDFHRVLDATVEAAQPMLRMFQAPYSVNKAQITPPSISRESSPRSSPTVSPRSKTKPVCPKRRTAGHIVPRASTPRNAASLHTSSKKLLPGKARRSQLQRLPSVTIKPDEPASKIPFDALVFFGDLNYRIDLPRRDIEHMHSQLLKKDATTAVAVDVLARGLSSDDDKGPTPAPAPPVRPAPALAKWDNRYTGLRSGDTTQRTTRSWLLARVLRHDQLNRQRKLGRAFVGFEEGEIGFPPTYKYDKGAKTFDTSSKRRCPAWTDRILFYTRRRASASALSDVAAAEQVPAGVQSSENIGSKSKNGVAGTTQGVQEAPVLALRDYYSVDARTSDHRPVCADFELQL